ncbi:hypothetical protein HK101_010325 [Irineochytrium annulatum]|nr:hypothetical protein HK101_010325 [Irineochytrium annulatum]
MSMSVDATTDVAMAGDAPAVVASAIGAAAKPSNADVAGEETPPKPATKIVSMSSIVTSASRGAAALVRVNYAEKDQTFFDERSLGKGTLGVLHIVVIVFGNIVTSCNAYWGGGLSTGYGYHLIGWFLMLLWFASFAVILCELMTMLPYMDDDIEVFASTGYLVGQCELSEYTLVAASCVTYLGNWAMTTAGTGLWLSPSLWVLLGIAVFALQLTANRTYYCILTTVAIAVMAFEVAPIFPVLGSIDPYRWAVVDFFDNYFGNGTGSVWNTSSAQTATPPFSIPLALFPTDPLTAFMNVCPLVVFSVAGLEMVPLMAEECVNFRRDGPRGLFISTVLTIVVFLCYIIIFPLVPPGAFGLQFAEIGPGFQPLATIFNISPDSSLYQAMNVLAALTALPTCFSTTYAFSRLAFALSRGGYVPTFLAWSRVSGKRERIPWAACIYGVVMILAVATISYFEGGTLDQVLAFTATM